MASFFFCSIPGTGSLHPLTKTGGYPRAALQRPETAARCQFLKGRREERTLPAYAWTIRCRAQVVRFYTNAEGLKKTTKKHSCSVRQQTNPWTQAIKKINKRKKPSCVLWLKCISILNLTIKTFTFQTAARCAAAFWFAFTENEPQMFVVCLLWMWEKWRCAAARTGAPSASSSRHDKTKQKHNVKQMTWHWYLLTPTLWILFFVGFILSGVADLS